ncbi:MAG: hypothetical protein HC769_12815 [Cyanobacteria bacterium CRU_2_1]|nr:hypothetical protein [Cyanobacteria bacterium RU_5_0]NJR59640.1 hypothetical protein [Cyanobacteria bacterium CRU_2_1]
MAWQAGQQIQGGKYTIDRILGIGGAGITYLARRQDGQRFVIKTLNDTVRLDPRFANYQTKLQQDFLNEALRLARCSHPREEILGRWVVLFCQ